MQPLEQPPELSAAERRRQNQQIVSRGSRISKSKKTALHHHHQLHEDPPIMMMSSMSGDSDSMTRLPGEPASPSQRLLLINEERAQQLQAVASLGRVKQKANKRNSSTKGGMSSKITKAFFPRKSSSHANFSKMDNDSFSDPKGSNFFKRSAKSPFNAVEPGNATNIRSADSGQLGSEPSFDNASTYSAPPEVPLQEPPNVRVLVQQQRQQSRTPPPRLPAKNTAGYVNISTDSSAVSDLGGSMQSKSAPPQSRYHLQQAAPAAPPAVLKAPSMSSTISVSSLNYSESQGASSYEQHNAAHNTHYNSVNHSAHSGLMGVKLASDSEDDAPLRTAVSLNTSISDLVQERALIQQQLLQERQLDQQEVNTSSPSPQAPAAAKIPILKPPPSILKVSRRMEATSANNNSHDEVSTAVSSTFSKTVLAGITNDPTATMEANNAVLKEHQERLLLQGGDFLDESHDDHASLTAQPELAIKLLHRLEAAQADDQLMMDHHHQDPPLQMSNSVSFGSSTIATLRSTSMTRNSSLARKASSASSTIATSQSYIPNNNNPYAGLTISEGIDLPLTEQTSHSMSAATELLLEVEEEVKADAVVPETVQDEEDDLVVVIVEDDQTRAKSLDEQSGAKSLCYLYSQDKEFENSILSPSTTHVSVMHQSHQTIPEAATPSHRYRSDAIDAFLEEAQHKINTSCSKDHCVQVMEAAATGVLDGGGVEEDDIDGVAVAPCSKPSLEDEAVDTGIRNEDDGKTMVSDDFLNMVTSGCTGVPDVAAKEAMKEKLVALEAGWSGFQTKFQERLQSMEDSWQGWNLNSLLRFPSPTKAAAKDKASAKEETESEATATMDDVEKTMDYAEKTQELPNTKAVAEATEANTPTTVGSTTVQTTPPTMSTLKMQSSTQPGMDKDKKHALDQLIPKNVFPDILPEVELINQPDSSVVGVMKNPSMMDVADVDEEVVLGVVRELEKTRIRSSSCNKRYEDEEALMMSNKAYDQDVGMERIEIGTTDRDVPLSLKHTLADISIIGDSGNPNTSGGSSCSRPLSQRPALDSSRDDSEGGKILLDAAEWDPVNSSAEVEEEEVPESTHATVHEAPRGRRASEKEKSSKPGGFVFFKRKRSKKKLQSPKSVLAEF